MGKISIERSFNPHVVTPEVAIPHTKGIPEQSPSSFSYGRTAQPELSRAPSDGNTSNDCARPETIQNDFPIQPRYLSDSKLPFVPVWEVARRTGNEGDRLWIVVDNIVLDCTEYKKKHPGGRGIIEGFGGHDCSWQWWSFHSGEIMERYGRSLRVGKTTGVSNMHERPVRQAFQLRMAGDQW